MPCSKTSTLATFIANGNWKQVLTLCEADAELSSLWYSLSNFYDCVDDEELFELLPIHHACDNKPPPRIIQALAESYPKC
eukprot:15328024-Ditylum_brightwellii.AAC.1